MLPRGTRPAAMDFCAIMALPLCGRLVLQNTTSLCHNLAFWSLLALATVPLIASHGGYAKRFRRGARAAPAGLAINCFLATSAAMLLLAALLGHPHILTRRWTVPDLVITPAALGLVRTLRASPASVHREGPSPC